MKNPEYMIKRIKRFFYEDQSSLSSYNFSPNIYKS